MSVEAPSILHCRREKTPGASVRAQHPLGNSPFQSYVSISTCTTSWTTVSCNEDLWDKTHDRRREPAAPCSGSLPGPQPSRAGPAAAAVLLPRLGVSGRLGLQTERRRFPRRWRLSRRPGPGPARRPPARGQGPADGRRQTDRSCSSNQGRTTSADQHRAGPPLLLVPSPARPSGRSRSPTAAVPVTPARSRHPDGGAHFAAASGSVPSPAPRPQPGRAPPGQQPAAPVARTLDTHRAAAAAAPHGAAATSARAPPARARPPGPARPLPTASSRRQPAPSPAGGCGQPALGPRPGRPARGGRASPPCVPSRRRQDDSRVPRASWQGAVGPPPAVLPAPRKDKWVLGRWRRRADCRRRPQSPQCACWCWAWLAPGKPHSCR